MTGSSVFFPVRFDPRVSNCLRADDARYMLLAGPHAAPVLVNARCPHRGGPLHLGGRTADGSAVVCPMHGLATRVSGLRRTQLPAIHRSDDVVALVPTVPGHFPDPESKGIRRIS